MDTYQSFDLLAQAIDRFSYFNPWKILPVVVLTFLWAKTLEWVDKDTDVVKTKREQWNVIVVSGGLVAYMLLFLPQWKGALYFAGLGAWTVVAFGSVVWYIIHRNGRVVPTAKVLTPGHLQRVISGQSSSGKAIKDKGQRIRVFDQKKEYIERPEDPETVYEYDTAQDFLFDVLWRRATEVDVLAGKESYRVVYKIDGVATERDTLPVEDGERIFRFLKRSAGLNIEEIRRPQTGKIRFATLSEEPEGDTEVTTSGTTAGERLHLHVGAGKQLMRIHELGIAEVRLEALRELLNRPTGLMIVSAPPQHGLTTTQYAILRAHDAYIQNIHTLEKKRMIELDNITQQIFDPSNAEVTYARMLQSVLRREPDIVMASNCEEREVAQIAARAGADDRKIYLGMNAQDCFDATDKYLKLVDDNHLAAGALIAVLNQRLLRILCEECREAFKPDTATLKKLNLPGDKIDMFYRPPTEPLVDKKGNPIICESCQGTGYVGRVGCFELMVIDDATRTLIAEGATINRIKSQVRKNKMYYLQEESLLKVIDGTTSMNEVLRALKSGGK